MYSVCRLKIFINEAYLIEEEQRGSSLNRKRKKIAQNAESKVDKYPQTKQMSHDLVLNIHRTLVWEAATTMDYSFFGVQQIKGLAS